MTAYLGFWWIASGSPGYPLDDSWIHQAVARNLALRGEWAINPGEPVSVSTAPLWTLLLVPGHLLGVPHLWTYLLGGLCLAGAGWQAAVLGRYLFPEIPWVAPAAGMLLLFEWHAVWAAASGMETLLFTGLTLATMTVGLTRRPAATGFLVAATAAVRPEGLLLGGLFGARALLDRRWGEAAGLLVAAALGLLPLLALNLLVRGSPLPATFIAKHAAYGVEAARLEFLVGALVELARGPLLLLYPGLLYFIYQTVRRRPIHQPASLPASIVDVSHGTQSNPVRGHHCALLWVAGMLVLYAWWLPVLYHHGRYLIPLLPVLLLYGIWGTAGLFRRLSLPVLKRTAPALLGVLTVASWLRGAQVYAENVAYVNGQHVRLARWFYEHTPEGSVVGTHDIGAMAYFSGRRLVDVAGLATRDLVAAARDVERATAVLEDHGASYIAVLPDWYPPLLESLQASGRYRPIAVDGLGTPPKGSSSFLVLERVQPAP